MRLPTAAGVLYHSTSDRLDSQIRECFEGERGPGELPLSRRVGDIKAALVPQGKYNVSGPCAAWVYKELGEVRFPQTYIILVGSSTVKEGIYLTQDSWQTPFGTVRCDKELAMQLLKKGLVKEDDKLHLSDYSIEVQLPFLQFVSKQNVHALKIIPLIVGSYSQDFVDFFIDNDLDVCFIVSSDLTRFGPKFMYTPYITGIKEKMEELDGNIVKGILNDDFSLFEKNRSFLGKEPLKIVNKIVKWQKAKPRLVHYYDSAEITGDYRNIVGHAGFIFK